jgi:serine/arginine repetitive matrix protein 1
MRKVNLTVIRPWIAKRIVDLGLDDDLVVEYAMGLLEDEQQPVSLPVLFMSALLTLLRLLTPKKCKLI